MRAVVFSVFILFQLLKLEACPLIPLHNSLSLASDIRNTFSVKTELWKQADASLDQNRQDDNDAFLICDADDDEDVNLVKARKNKVPSGLGALSPAVMTAPAQQRFEQSSPLCFGEFARKYILQKSLII